MLLREMIVKYPEQYIAVAHVQKGIDNLIQTATVLTVYPTLQDAYKNLKQIKDYMKRYSDFDIIYGDYEDYVSTRRRMVVIPEKDILTQEEIDEMIGLMSSCFIPTQFEIGNLINAISEAEDKDG